MEFSLNSMISGEENIPYPLLWYLVVKKGSIKKHVGYKIIKMRSGRKIREKLYEYTPLATLLCTELVDRIVKHIWKDYKDCIFCPRNFYSKNSPPVCNFCLKYKFSKNFIYKARPRYAMPDFNRVFIPKEHLPPKPKHTMKPPPKKEKRPKKKRFYLRGKTLTLKG